MLIFFSYILGILISLVVLKYQYNTKYHAYQDRLVEAQKQAQKEFLERNPCSTCTTLGYACMSCRNDWKTSLDTYMRHIGRPDHYFLYSYVELIIVWSLIWPVGMGMLVTFQIADYISKKGLSNLWKKFTRLFSRSDVSSKQEAINNFKAAEAVLQRRK